MKIIVTGFEPFGGAETNASWEAVKDLRDVRTVLLPVSFRRAAGMIRSLAAEEPDLLICVGEAGNRKAISLERIAVNWMDARIPDNDGWQPVDEKICPDRPAAWFPTLPVREMAEAVQAAGIPAELSWSAGTYVCNTVFYSLMDEIDRLGLKTKGGFIHVPAGWMEPGQLRGALEAAIRQAAGKSGSLEKNTGR